MSDRYTVLWGREDRDISLGLQPEGRLPGGSGLEGLAEMRLNPEREGKAKSRCRAEHEH